MLGEWTWDLLRHFGAAAIFQVLFALLLYIPAEAAQPIDNTETLDLPIGVGRVISLPAPATAVFVADPEVADVHVATAQSIFVFGKKAGTTTLYVMGERNRPLLQRAVVVSLNLGALQSLLKMRFSQLDLTLTSSPGSLMVSGQVPTPADADAVVRTLSPYLRDKEAPINQMTLARPIQVSLRVRVTEVDRNVTQRLGINWSAIGSSGNFLGGILSGRVIQDPTTGIYQLPPTNTVSILGGFKAGRSNIQGLLDALDQEGLLTVLAEPNLTAMSGETASFLAGGEYPIPVAQQQGMISIDYKSYGVSLDFTPTVLADNRISLKVRPEVSELDISNAVTLSGVQIPALSVRRVETTVELSSGQSFAIAGLLQSSTSDVLSELPGLGRLPVLGKLFSSRAYQNNKTEIVVIVTPHIVTPSEPGRLRQAIDSVTRPSNDIEYVLQRAIGIDPLSGAAPRLVGAAGFVY